MKLTLRLSQLLTAVSILTLAAGQSQSLLGWGYPLRVSGAIGLALGAVSWLCMAFLIEQERESSRPKPVLTCHGCGGPLLPDRAYYFNGREYHQRCVLKVAAKLKKGGHHDAA